MCSFVRDFIALEIRESVLTFHDGKFCKFHVLYACSGDACALETRRRVVTERGKVSMDSLIARAMKSQTNEHTVRGRPTLKAFLSAFATGRSASLTRDQFTSEHFE